MLQKGISEVVLKLLEQEKAAHNQPDEAVLSQTCLYLTGINLQNIPIFIVLHHQE